MAKAQKRVEVQDNTRLLSVAEEVRATGEPHVLRRNGEDIAVVVPVERKQRPPSRARPVTRDDALFRLVGIGHSGIPGGISGRKHEFLGRGRRSR